MVENKYYLLLVLLILLSSCQNQRKKNGEYQDKANNSELYANESYTLPAELNEISGITFLSNSQEFVYAIQDEEGIVYTYDLKNGVISSQFEFGPEGDYEEITTDGQFFYVLQSDGTIYSFPISMDVDQGKVSVYNENIEKGEYESLAYDHKTNSLVLVCKSCQSDKGKPSLSGYVLNVLDKGQLSFKEKFSIDIGNIQNFESKPLESLKPSSISKRNTSNEWYILSSVDNLLIILDESFQSKSLYHFKKKQFAQPEGITFNNQDQMYISSEKGKANNAFIYQINLKN